MKIQASEDCGNSPKNAFLQDMTIAFARGDAEFILSRVTEDIRWELVGKRIVQGIASLAEALEEENPEETVELTIQHAATHGRAGAVNGMLYLKNGGKLAFCHVFEFNGAKATLVKDITSYVIAME